MEVSKSFTEKAMGAADRGIVMCKGFTLLILLIHKARVPISEELQVFDERCTDVVAGPRSESVFTVS